MFSIDFVKWFGRFIAVTDPDDLYILALWAMHTHLVSELYTTPRLLIDSTVFGSGKTTVLEHLAHLCPNPVQAASLSSPALIPRMLESGMRTVLLDEVDRSLRPDKPGVEDMIAILNSGYKFGAAPAGSSTGERWRGTPGHADPRTCRDGRKLAISARRHGDAAAADSSDARPRRSHRGSDREAITDDATALRATAARWADNIRADIKGLKVDLAEKCIGRSKEKWRPMKRIAVLAGGHWPETTDRRIARNLAEDAAEREAGLKAQPPGMILLTDLHHIWPTGEPGEQLVPTRELVGALIAHNPTTGD
jgi:Protein of unknown function (DUF3631)